MRYYNFAINTNSEQLRENAKIDLKGYCFNNPINALNHYMYHNMKNGLTFIAYREEETTLFVALAIDEDIWHLSETCDYICEILNEYFGVKRIEMKPEEITTFDFVDCFIEAKRRRYVDIMTYIDMAKVSNWFELKNGVNKLHYEYDQTIISANEKKITAIYDKSFKEELDRINDTSVSGNMFHYVISARSTDATKDLVQALAKKLYKSNRLSSKRIDFISEMKPDMFTVTNHLEDIFENNKGGMVVIDLSEKLGCDPVDYRINCKYIERLVKNYRKQCLFVFTYNMDKPGFSYMLLPELKKHIMPVMLREGTGNRKAAFSYLKELIKESDYIQYVNKANDFFKTIEGDTFSQTDVIRAYEKFEMWCLNENEYKSYKNHISEDLFLDRDENEDSAYDKLNKMIGLSLVKEQINSILASDIVEKERKKRKGKNYQASTMHMIFGGNPGSAKTTVAKLFAGIAKEKGIIKSGAFVERGGMDLDGLGCVDAIRKSFAAAKGGVLFIDEAYSLKSDVAITTLLQEMENQRENVIVILAGYNDRMQEFMNRNEGLKSRIPYWIEFPDYNADELTDIFKLMVKERGFTITDDAVKEAHYIFDKVRYNENFGNGRYVRNLLDHAAKNQSVRILLDKENVSDINKRELFLIKQEDIATLDEGLKEERITGTAKKELEEMIGLSSAKSVINKAMANYKLAKLCMERGIAKDRSSLHMVFTGNPGTAKTTVARLFAEIMKDEKVLSSGNFVEVGRADLVGDHVGSTAPLVKKKFKEAQGGVLFIDEAYSLCDNAENSFGDEAINTLVQEMENHREDVIVIFAGYPEPMKKFLDRNPGMASRIAFQIEFEDYTTEELCEITKLMLSRKQMKITDEAMAKLRNQYDEVRTNDDYGNGRYVRKILEEAEMNLAQRVVELKESEITTELITTIEVYDIPEVSKNHEKKQPIGFYL